MTTATKFEHCSFCKELSDCHIKYPGDLLQQCSVVMNQAFCSFPCRKAYTMSRFKGKNKKILLGCDKRITPSIDPNTANGQMTKQYILLENMKRAIRASKLMEKRESGSDRGVKRPLEIEKVEVPQPAKKIKIIEPLKVDEKPKTPVGYLVTTRDAYGKQTQVVVNHVVSALRDMYPVGHVMGCELIDDKIKLYPRIMSDPLFVAAAEDDSVMVEINKN
jgi:hypothetical protein